MPDGVMLYLVITGFHGHIRFAEWERKGNEYQRPLMELLHRLPQHGELVARVRRGETGARPHLAEQRDLIDRAFAALQQVDARIGRDLQFTDEGLGKRKREHYHVATVRREWEELKARLNNLALEEAAARHRHLVADVRGMISHAGDLSNLILDPDLDSYYLMDATLLALPQMQDRLGEMMAYGTAVLEQPARTAAEQRQLAIFANLLQEVDTERVVASIHTALNEDRNFYGPSATLQARLPQALAEFTAVTEAFTKVTARLADANQPGMAVAEYRASGERARAACAKLWATAAGELDTLLQIRISAYQHKRNVSLLVAACAFVAAVSFVSFITRSISGPLQRQAAQLAAANEAAQAEIAERIRTEAAMRQIEAETQTANQALQRQIVERDKAEAALRHSQAELEAAQAVTSNMMAEAQESRRKTEQAYAEPKREVAGRKQAEAQFLQSQKMDAIGHLAGGVAHDFNNLLAAIIMQTELATLPDSTPAEVQDGLQQIRANAQRAANLTRQLLLFSRKEVMKARQLDLNEVVSSLHKMLQRIIGEDVRLEFHPHPAPLPIFADAGMLDQVMLNLAVNARDAMPGGGRLRIETGEKLVDEELARSLPDAVPGRSVWLSVSDTGTGIAPEVLPHIFEPFFTTKEAGKGTGLGLATVFGIVKQHHGWISVLSEPGKGTTFQVFFPASTAAEAAPMAAQPSPRGGTETILLVEDEPSVRSMARAHLKRVGYRVIEASSGAAALEQWPDCRTEVALVLTDLVMPEGVSGHELAAQLQADRPSVKIIFMSGYSAEIAGKNLRLQPGQNFLQKPFESSLLLETVRRVLDGSTASA